MKGTAALIANRILSILSGVIAASIVIGAIQMINYRLYPMPEGVSPDNVEAFEQYVADLPVTAYIVLLLAAAIGALVGGFVASQMAKVEKRGAALFTGLILTVAGVLNIISIPHPLWYSISSLSIYVPMALLGNEIRKLILGKNKTTKV